MQVFLLLNDGQIVETWNSSVINAPEEFEGKRVWAAAGNYSTSKAAIESLIQTKKALFGDENMENQK